MRRRLGSIPALDDLESFLGSRLRRTEQPGCAVDVHVGGRIVFDRAWGVAAGIMPLRERGLLRLDDPVGTLVAGLPPLVAGRTIIQLLSHASGLVRDGADCGRWDDVRPFPDEAGLRAELARGEILGPAERLKYSKVGFGLLRPALAGVTGEPFDTWIAREVAMASGLAETTPDVPADET